MVGDEQPVDAEHRGEQQRHQQHARREVALDGRALQREVEDDERRDAEQRHRGDGLRRAQLEQQLLAQQRGDGVPHRYSAPMRSASTSAAGASSSTRPARRPSARSASASPPAGSWLVIDARARRRRRRSAARRARRPTGRGSRAARRAAAARGRAARRGRRPARWTMPRENVWTGSSARGVEADLGQQLLDPRLADAVQARVEAQVLARAEVAVEQRRVAEQAERARGPPSRRAAARRRGPRRPGVRAQQRGEHAQQRRLARAVGAEDDERRARGQRRA